MKHLSDLYAKALEDYEKELIKRQELEKIIKETIEILKQPQFQCDNIPCNLEEDIDKLRKKLGGI